MHALIPLILASAVYMPRTDERTMTISPLAEGEIAHEVIAERSRVKGVRGQSREVVENAAKLWVGGANGTPLAVVDGSALRGYKIVTLERGEYSIASDPGIVYDAVADVWSAASAPIGIHRIVITAPSHVDIQDLLFESQADTVADLSPEEIGSISSAVDGNVAVITFDKRANPSSASRKFEVRKIVLQRIGFGSSAHVTDLSTHIFNLRDSLGDWTLGGLRSWVKHLYDGNRGADWSRYPATNRVWLNGRTLTFDARKRYSFVCDDGATNLTLTASGAPVFSVYSSGTGEGYEDAFMFVDFRQTPSNVVFRYAHDIDGFDLAQLKVQYNTALSPTGWLDMPAASYVDKTNGRIECTGSFTGTRFFRLNYNGIVSRVCRVEFHEPVEFAAGLTVRGAAVLDASATNAIWQVLGNANALLEGALNGGAE